MGACESTFPYENTEHSKLMWFLWRSWDLRNLRKTDSSRATSFTSPGTAMAVSKLAVYARRFPIVPSMLTYSVLYPTANLVQQYCFRKSTAETGIDWKEVSRSVGILFNRYWYFTLVFLNPGSVSMVVFSTPPWCLTGCGWLPDCSPRTRPPTSWPRCSSIRPASPPWASQHFTSASPPWRGRASTQSTRSGGKSSQTHGR